MSGYYDRQEILSEKMNRSPGSTVPKALPIKPKKERSWSRKSDPGRLVKKFKITNEEKMMNFVGDVLEMQAEKQHHGKIVIEYPHVSMEIFTHMLNDVTELDFEWAQAVDDIFTGYKK